MHSLCRLIKLNAIYLNHVLCSNRLHNGRSREIDELQKTFMKSNESKEIIRQNGNWLLQLPVSMSTLKLNGQVLLIAPNVMKLRVKKLKSNNQWNKYDDFVPLVKSNLIYNAFYKPNLISDRIYVLAEHCKVDAHKIAQICVNHTFIFNLLHNSLERKLRLLSDIAPEFLLGDITILIASEKRIENRINEIKSYGVTQIKPWMIKCTNQTFQRSMEIRSKRNHNQNKVLDFLQDKLHWHGTLTYNMFNRFTFISKLDYNETFKLLNELLTVLSENEITKNIYLLKKPADKVVHRIKYLQTLQSNIDAKLLEMNNKSFEHYVKNFQYIKNKN